MHFDIYKKHPCCRITLLFDQKSLGTIRFDVFPTLIEEKQKIENFSKIFLSPRWKKPKKIFFEKFCWKLIFSTFWSKIEKIKKIENFFENFSKSQMKKIFNLKNFSKKFCRKIIFSMFWPKIEKIKNRNFFRKFF